VKVCAPGSTQPFGFVHEPAAGTPLASIEPQISNL